MPPKKRKAFLVKKKKATTTAVPERRSNRIRNKDTLESIAVGKDSGEAQMNATDSSDETSDTPQDSQESFTMRADSNSIEEIFSGTYMSEASTSSELCRRLRSIWEHLKFIPNHNTSQEELKKAQVSVHELSLVSREIFQEKILESREKNVRSLAACCLVDMMRIHAPRSPFKDNDELCTAFELIFEQLKALSAERDASTCSAAEKTALGIQFYHILENLADVKPFVLFIGISHVDEIGEPSLLVQLVNLLYDIVRPEHSLKISNLMISILVTCIEEIESIDALFLNALLAPLVRNHQDIDMHEQKIGNASQSTAYYLASEAIRRTGNHLQTYLSHVFNSVLVDLDPKFGVSIVNASFLKENVYTLIYELHKINPDLLLYIFPSLCMQLQVDEIAIRSNAIQLLGKLFASECADYGTQFVKVFRDFLGRFRDVSQVIRLDMIQIGVLIWQKKHDLGPLIEKECILRLNDSEWEVRRAVVNEVCDLAANYPDILSDECLREVGERMKDKRILIRKEAMTGLSQVFATHISSVWVDNNDDSYASIVNSIPKTALQKLSWIPDYVLKCFAYPQQELRLRVIQLLDDILLPKSLSSEIRAKILLFLFQYMDDVSREAFRRILAERYKCLTAFRAFLRARKSMRRSSKDTNEDLAKHKTSLVATLATLSINMDTLSSCMDQLTTWKDHKVFALLESICDATEKQKESRSTRDRLLKCVGTKSHLGVFLKDICRRMNLLTISVESVKWYLTVIKGEDKERTKDRWNAIQIVVLVSKVMPDILYPFKNQQLLEPLALVRSINKKTDSIHCRIIKGALEATSNVCKHFESSTCHMDESEGISNDLYKMLYEICSGNHEIPATFQQGIAKSAAKIFLSTGCRSENRSADIRRLCAEKNLSSMQDYRLLSILASLQVFAKRRKGWLGESEQLFDANTWQILLQHIKISENASGDASDSGAKLQRKQSTPTAARIVDIRTCVIRLLVEALLNAQGGENDVVKTYGRDLLNALFDMLRSDGTLWTSNAALMPICRATAATSLIKLIRSEVFEAQISVSEWHLLGFVMQDSTLEVRAAFLRTLTKNLMKKRIAHPHKYLCYLALAATESNMALKKQAKAVLLAAAKRMRHIFEAAAVVYLDVKEADEEKQSRNALIVPEYALPYVIHLLSHHPDFPNSLETMSDQKPPHIAGRVQAILSDQIAYLNFFLDGLVSSSSSLETDNIAFILQILVKLSNCVDITAPKENKMQYLVGTTVELLKKKIKNQSNLKTFPGTIFLPKRLYAPKSAVADDAASSSTIDADAQSTRVFRMSTSLSPIKSLEFGGPLMSFQSVLTPKKRQRSPNQKSDSAKKRSKSSPRTPGSANSNVSRRSTPMRQARLQTKYFNESTDNEDDSDCGVPSSSRGAKPSEVAGSKHCKNDINKPISDDCDDAEDEMESFQSVRRKRIVQ